MPFGSGLSSVIAQGSAMTVALDKAPGGGADVRVSAVVGDKLKVKEGVDLVPTWNGRGHRAN